ncbi:Aste57867_17405 [Aphanomyces stellatus]|uniref:Aste57867_17405 protein n=1 Tax=Aphanomyces stellatus TaxID=120398 RepID=A0A485L9D0_9STRA|nr:hypothetical protein As57867_017345 [Aphanomyces stellatus]VFT94161.1 Aste57867_17405 [Aphanomyces stellatus]
MSTSAPSLRLREEPLSIPKSTKKPWDGSTKTTHAPRKSKTHKEEDEVAVLPSPPTATSDAHALVEKAVESALSATAALDSPIIKDVMLPDMFIKGIEWAVTQDRRICDASTVDADTTASSHEVALQLEQVQLERARRKVIIQAFQRQVGRQIQRLQEMSAEVTLREAGMDAAFDQFETLLRCQEQS